jgi:deazaflavin-dependent oxidoreductase (nitroreductase family)
MTPQQLFSALQRLPIDRLYRLRLGWLLGHRFLVLTHTGRHTGLSRRTVLEVLQYDAAHRRVVVASGLGRESNWYRNLQCRPEGEVAIGRERFRVVPEVLGEEEAEAVLAEYEHRNRWIAPVVHRAFSWLVGWRYDGSPVARQRLIRQLPLVALRPS